MKGVTLIGISGRKRHGKDTVGGFLQEKEGFTPIAFADPLKKAAMEWWGFSYDQVYGDSKEVVDERWGFTPRFALQQLGTEVGRNIDPQTWVRLCLRTIEQAAAGEAPVIHMPKYRAFLPATADKVNLTRWCVTDCRFPNEADFIQVSGGYVLKVVRPSLMDQGDMHQSETSIDSIQEDYLLVNDAGLEELAAKVDELLEGVLR